MEKAPTQPRKAKDFPKSKLQKDISTQLQPNPKVDPPNQHKPNNKTKKKPRPPKTKKISESTSTNTTKCFPIAERQANRENETQSVQPTNKTEDTQKHHRSKPKNIKHGQAIHKRRPSPPPFD